MLWHIILIFAAFGGFLLSFCIRHKKHQPDELHRERKIAFALGAISVVSWYSAFILGVLRKLPIEFSLLLLIYLFILGSAVIGSQFMERSFVKRANSS